jgi:hypothetical protein
MHVVWGVGFPSATNRSDPPHVPAAKTLQLLEGRGPRQLRWPRLRLVQWTLLNALPQMLLQLGHSQKQPVGLH